MWKYWVLRVRSVWRHNTPDGEYVCVCVEAAFDNGQSCICYLWLLHSHVLMHPHSFPPPYSSITEGMSCIPCGSAAAAATAAVVRKQMGKRTEHCVVGYPLDL